MAPKTADQWKSFDSVEEPAQLLLEDEYKTGQVKHDYKAAHSLGNSKASFVWNQAKGDKAANATCAFENTSSYNGSNWKLKVGAGDLEFFRCMGLHSAGGYNVNPWWAVKANKTHGTTWWAYSKRFGFISHWDYKGWDMNYWCEGTHTPKNQAGPGEFTWRDYFQGTKACCQWSLNHWVSTSPGKSWTSTVEPGYSWKHGDWTAFWKHKWSNPWHDLANFVGDGAEGTVRVTYSYGKNAQFGFMDRHKPKDQSHNWILGWKYTG